MDRNDRESIWNRRTSNKPASGDAGDSSNSRTFPTKRFAQDGSNSRNATSNNPFNNIAPLATTGISSPSGSGHTASSAFGLGSGAFASFGASGKAPKTPGSAPEVSKPAQSSNAIENKKEKDKEREKSATGSTKRSSAEDMISAQPLDDSRSGYPLKHTWVIWYRPPHGKSADYEKSTRAMCRMSTATEFWKVYVHLKPPSALPVVSDYHFFKEGIRPVWEDEENRRGGKWIMRLKKGVCDRYWEDLLLAMVGDQFMEASEEVCGAVLSVRSGEDVLAVWTKNDGGRNIKIRETIKRVLNLPGDTIIQWKSHDDSIAQRTALDHARQEKTPGGNANQSQDSGKRRTTVSSQDGDSGIVGLGVKGGDTKSGGERTKGSG